MQSFFIPENHLAEKNQLFPRLAYLGLSLAILGYFFYTNKPSVRLQVCKMFWTIWSMLTHFLYLSKSILVYLYLSWSISTYLGSSQSILVYLDLFRFVMIYLGLPWVILGRFGQRWDIFFGLTVTCDMSESGPIMPSYYYGDEVMNQWPNVFYSLFHLQLAIGAGTDQ